MKPDKEEAVKLTRPKLERVSFTEILKLNSYIVTLYYFICWLGCIILNP